MPRLRTFGALALSAPASVVLALATAGQALACGGLIGENGTIQLSRTTTLAAYHDGIERYVTSFQFTGEGSSVGSIVPLPDEPTEVVRGGDWTLQRLAQEVAPPSSGEEGGDVAVAATADGARVILETEIDALDITVLEGGGDEVGAWAVENGFLLPPDAPEVLDHYGRRSPYFMAARFDAARAAALGQRTGEGTPIMVTIPTAEPWVPLRILALGAQASQVIDADVFLLTDDKPQLLAGGPGLSLERSEPASQPLLADLRSDAGMEWVPEEMWLTFLRLSTTAGALDYDLATATHDGVRPSLRDAGVDVGEALAIGADEARRFWPWWPAGVGAVAAAAFLLVTRRPRSAS